MSDFVHLHCHTEYSLLDGAIRIKDLCAKAKAFGMPAAAITDHGNLFGALNFYSAAKEHGLKPIIGCEVYTCPDHTDKSQERGKLRFHLVLLAQNHTGYHNLVKLVSHGWLHGFYRKPRVDKALLRQYSEGIIALSACISGEIPRTFMKSGMDAALRQTEEYADIFPGRFYLELQSNGLAMQEKVNTALLEIGQKKKVPIVATNDCHYLNAEDADANDILLCIQTGKKVSDQNRMRFETQELYYKSPEEMAGDFAGTPEALENSLRIVEACSDYNFKFEYHFPVYDLPAGTSPEEEFRALACKGLEQRLAKMPYAVDEKLYRERLEHEVQVICDMGFPGYFLIVQDFINWAIRNGVPVGPGRGSAVGSLVAYALRITNLDPIPHNLLFERFLNSERISMPDIDVDFCEAKRQRVIEYVNRKYGAESVSQITTFGKMMAKAVVRDVGRALGMTFQETDRIAKLIPSFPQTGPKINLKHLLNAEEFAKLFADKTDEDSGNKDRQLFLDAEELRNSYAHDAQVRKLLDTAMRLEGLVRHASVHAAGLVLSDRPMTEYLPVYRGKGENDVVTQFDMKMVEKVGLVKFDFLGLRNLTVIENTLQNIKKQGKEAPDIDTLPLDDPKVYQMYSRGDTDGVFQMESSGMRRYLKQLKPTVFEDLIAMVSLYRPGPMDNIPEFIRRKHGREEMSYPLPELEECLKNTYGIMVYQEQVMQIARIVAGYSLGGADLLRRAMGKKDHKAMEAEQSKFVSGALALGVAEKDARNIFNLVNKFAGYGFNKSHAAAYALISYQTAWLKSHYPTEFMAALLSSEMNDHDKLLKYAATCKDMRVGILPPDVNSSFWNFTVRDKKMIYGLGGIKNVGEEAVREMTLERENNGPFTSLFDLCYRLSTRKMNKRALESLIKGGACDTFGVSRAALAAALDEAVSKAQKKNKTKQSGRISLLAMMPETASEPGIGYACQESSIEEWDNAAMSRFEKEALGFYFTSHPLQPFRREMERLGLTPLEECRDMKPNTAFACAVLAKIDKVRTDSKDRRWAILQVEDLTAKASALCYSSAYEKFKDILLPDTPLYMEGRINRPNSFDKDENPEDEDDTQKEISFRVEKVMLLPEACRQNHNPCCLEISHDEVTPDRLVDLKRILSRHKGSVPLHLLLDLGESWCRLGLDKGRGINPGPPFYQDIKSWEEAGV